MANWVEVHFFLLVVAGQVLTAALVLADTAGLVAAAAPVSAAPESVFAAVVAQNGRAERLDAFADGQFAAVEMEPVALARLGQQGGRQAATQALSAVGMHLVLAELLVLAPDSQGQLEC